MEEFKKQLETTEKLRPSTINNYVRRLAFVEKTFGLEIDEIDLEDWKEVILQLEQTGASSESMRAYITAIIKYLRLISDNSESIDEYVKYHKKLSGDVKETNMKKSNR